MANSGSCAKEEFYGELPSSYLQKAAVWLYGVKYGSHGTGANGSGNALTLETKFRADCEFYHSALCPVQNSETSLSHRALAENCDEKIVGWLMSPL